MTRRMTMIFRSAVAMVLLTATGASAETLICSIQSVIECASDDYCGPPSFGGRRPATFVSINTDEKKITLLAPEERRGEVTEIQTLVETQDGWLLAGVEHGRSWSMLISGSGDVTMSITMDGAVWSGFGKWMSAEHVEP